MNKAVLFNFIVDKEANRIRVDRSFDAPADLVWAAWTEAAILDQWWAPKPYRNETKEMDFRVGGHWLYSMVSPQGERHWCRFNYTAINPGKSYAGSDAFCDEQGVENDTKPKVKWNNHFNTAAAGTVVNVELEFHSLDDLEQLIQMGFREGFTMGLENLDQYILAQSHLHK